MSGGLASLLLLVSWATSESVADLPKRRLVKPFNLSELRDAVESVIGGAGGEK